MTQEEKDLLMRDLCARIPYGVICEVTKNKDVFVKPLDMTDFFGPTYKDKRPKNYIHTIRPYLRPMSSMTEEEKKEYKHIAPCIVVAVEGVRLPNIHQIEWLLRNHFDFNHILCKLDIDEMKTYHTLIELGLAIAVTEENNPYRV